MDGVSIRQSTLRILDEEVRYDVISKGGQFISFQELVAKLGTP